MTGQNAPTKIDVIPLTENPADTVASASADTVVKNVTAHGLCVGTGLCNRDRNGGLPLLTTLPPAFRLLGIGRVGLLLGHSVL
jgi:hypothetical protein